MDRILLPANNVHVSRKNEKKEPSKEIKGTVETVSIRKKQKRYDSVDSQLQEALSTILFWGDNTEHDKEKWAQGGFGKLKPYLELLRKP